MIKKKLRQPNSDEKFLHVENEDPSAVSTK